MTVWDASTHVVGQPIQPEMCDYLARNGIDPMHCRTVEDDVLDGPVLRASLYITDENGQPRLTEDGTDVLTKSVLVLRRDPLPSWWDRNAESTRGGAA